MKGIVVTASPKSKIIRVELPETPYEALSVLVGGTASVVHPMGLNRPFCFVCNDDFFSLGLSLNPVGSYFYGTQHHGHPIYGNIVFLKEERGPEGVYDLVGLTDQERETMMLELREYFFEDWAPRRLPSGDTLVIREEADAT